MNTRIQPGANQHARVHSPTQAPAGAAAEALASLEQDSRNPNMPNRNQADARILPTTSQPSQPSYARISPAAGQRVRVPSHFAHRRRCHKALASISAWLQQPEHAGLRASRCPRLSHRSLAKPRRMHACIAPPAGQRVRVPSHFARGRRCREALAPISAWL